MRLQVVVVAPGAPMDAPTKFGGSPVDEADSGNRLSTGCGASPPTSMNWNFSGGQTMQRCSELNLLSGFARSAHYTRRVPKPGMAARFADDKTQKMIMQAGVDRK